MDLKIIAHSKRKGEIDVLLFISIFILVGIGIAMSYSASAVFALHEYKDSFFFMKKQIVWVCVGFIALFIFQEIDYHVYVRYTKVMLLISFVFLILVLIPGIGIGVKGSVRWLGYGAFRIQPSEFIKLMIAIYLVKVFSSENSHKTNRVLQMLIPMLVISVMFVLIILQPNFGTATGLLAVSVCILFVSGFPIFYILSIGIVSIPMFYLLIYQVQYRRGRILAFLDPWKVRYSEGYHIVQSFIAFKSGGLFGVGLGFGNQKEKRLPEPHTDFIFAVIAEETGFIGTVFIVILYCIIFWRGYIISLSAEDELGSLMAIGLTLLLVVQAFINIGVVTGSLPITGITLPLISYGGSSFISCMISLGILLNISKGCNRINPDFHFNSRNLQYE